MTQAVVAPPSRIDFATVAAMAAIVSVISTALHEIGGHGGACLAVGGGIEALGAYYVECDSDGLAPWRVRAIAAAGSAMNLVAALASLLALPAAKSAGARLFWWLFASLNAFVCAGYLIFSGVSGFGDWGENGVLTGVPHALSWRIAVTLLGAVAYFLVALASARGIGALLGGTSAARWRARLIAWTAYFTGGVVSVLIGLLNPVGIFIVIASAAASSFGGKSGLLWLAELAPGNDREESFIVSRNWPLLLAAVVLAGAYALLLGPTIVLRQ